MRHPLSRFLALGPELAAFILTSPFAAPGGAFAAAQSAVPSPNLDLQSLGSVAIGGDFDSISLYTHNGQNENVFRANGSQSLLTQHADGTFDSVELADAYIMSMCALVGNDGTPSSVIVGGNFTSLGGVEAQGIASYNPQTSKVTALSGLSGRVNAVYCDSSSGTVYVGGSFMAGNSTNAIAWTTEWVNLPFAGFNGPVNSITKNAAGNIVFGGDFDGLGNTTTPKGRDEQAVNLGSGNITASGTTSTAGFDDPTNIICKTASQGGSGNSWLLEDNTAGWWEGSFSFGFNPTTLRLYNTQQANHGTKTFYFEVLNSGGILNLTYVDPDGRNRSCSSACPLPQNNATEQDFHFTPPVGMSSFRIYVTEWYGDGGGFDGIEVFQDDIYSFAIDAFNEPKCDSVSTGANTSVSPATGLWDRVAGHGRTTSDYLSASLNDSSQLNPDTSVVFTPSIRESGNYSITIYTPGCLQDNTCATRGRANITVSMTSKGAPITTTVHQTNDYDKYDQIYFGHVDVDSDAFEPSVTLTPEANQNVPLTVVAQRVRFELIASTGGLNGLFEYDANMPDANSDFSQSAIDVAGTNLGTGAIINALINSDNSLFVAGNFSGNGASNVLSVRENASTLANGGLNSEVQTMWANGSLIYMGGNFTNTAEDSVSGLQNVAVYDTSKSKWSALGAGVKGPVYALVPLSLNITSDTVENCLTVNGDFTSVNGFDGNAAFTADGFAIWVPSHSNWLNNIPSTNVAINGKLSTYTAMQGSSPLYAGQLTSEASKYSDAVGLSGNGQPSLTPLGVQIKPSTTSSSSRKHKRATSSGQDFSGVYDGMFFTNNGLNITVLGGRFATTASDGSAADNLVFINNTQNAAQAVSGVSGLDSNSTFVALDYYQSSLYAGGAVTGTVNGNAVDGLIVYDLQNGAYATVQPPALAGDTVTVNSIAAQPDSSNVFVGGAFESAGSLPCATLCYYDASVMQWRTPGTDLSGTITSMVWVSNDELVIAGDLVVGGNATTMATFDAKKQTYAEWAGASTLPGPISVLITANSDYDEFWAAGTATSGGSSYLSKYSDNKWTAASGLDAGTVIRGLQTVPLTSSHDPADLLSDNEVLLVTGNIAVPNFGNASAVLFNGTDYVPFILTNRADGSQGTVSQVFLSNPQNVREHSTHHLALGLVVLIGLAISLGLIFFIVVAGILIERQRRRREGYVPMPMDKSGNLRRIPPQALLEGLGDKGVSPKL